MQIFHIFLFLCVNLCIATSVRKSAQKTRNLTNVQNKEEIQSIKITDLPDLNHSPPPEEREEVHQNVDQTYEIAKQQQDHQQKPLKLKNKPKGMTEEEFRMYESERKRVYRAKKGAEWRKMQWRKESEQRKERLEKSDELLKRRREILRDTSRRARARRKAKKLGIPEAPENALRRLPKERKPYINDNP